MKSNYWSCSKLADWIRGTPKPLAGTTEEWNAWHKKAKIKKIRYWIAEEGLDHLQDFFNWPASRINDLRFYANNRWISKSHALTSNLKRGQWHEFDTRLLHAVFDELINFVEIEQAWMFVVFSDEERKKYKTPWYRTILRIRAWRCPEAGIAYLEWATALKHNEDWIDKNDPNFGKPTHQALAAQETLALYNWWKVERPKRPDPSDASGWSNYCEEKRKTIRDATFWNSLSTNDDDKEYSSKILDALRKIEQEQDEEDTAMLIRLIKIRQSLWT
jgi:hypothetical protein